MCCKEWIPAFEVVAKRIKALKKGQFFHRANIFFLTINNKSYAKGRPDPDFQTPYEVFKGLTGVDAREVMGCAFIT